MVLTKEKDTAFHLNPDIERYADYRDKYHKNFKKEWRTSWRPWKYGAVFFIVIPTIIFWDSKLGMRRTNEYRFGLPKEHSQNYSPVNVFHLVRQDPAEPKERLNYLKYFEEAEKGVPAEDLDMSRMEDRGFKLAIDLKPTERALMKPSINGRV